MKDEEYIKCSSGKVVFSKKEAETTLNKAVVDKHRNVKPVRIYHCPECNMWHLTHSKEDDGIGGRIKPIVLKHSKAFRKYITDEDK